MTPSRLRQTILHPAWSVTTKQRNQLALETFEALQILKSAYRNGHMSAPAEAEKYYHTVMSVLGGEDHDADGPAASFF